MCYGVGVRVQNVLGALLPELLCLLGFEEARRAELRESTCEYSCAHLGRVPQHLPHSARNNLASFLRLFSDLPLFRIAVDTTLHSFVICILCQKIYLPFLAYIFCCFDVTLFITMSFLTLVFLLSGNRKVDTSSPLLQLTVLLSSNRKFYYPYFNLLTHIFYLFCQLRLKY